MSREIKFRGYIPELEKWVYGYVFQLPWATFIISDEGFEHRQRVSHDSVGEYTGLKDKNGK